MEALRMVSDEQIRTRMETAGYGETHDPLKAIFLMRDGGLVSGYDPMQLGDRIVDHRCIENCFADGFNRYADRFWEEALARTGMVMLVPETKEVVWPDTVTPTSAQRRWIRLLQKAGYECEGGVSAI